MEEMSPALAFQFRVGAIKLVSENPGPDTMAEDSVSTPPATVSMEMMPDPRSEEEDLVSVGPEPSVGSPCSVNSDCSSVASSLEDFSVFFSDGFEPGISSGDMITGADLVPAMEQTELRDVPAPCPGLARGRSVFLLDYVPLWGFTSICGRRPEMEDAVAAVPRFFQVSVKMLTADLQIDGLDPNSFRLPAHFFGVYDGHGGAQGKNPCSIDGRTK
jgi:protein phosphatase 2C